MAWVSFNFNILLFSEVAGCNFFFLALPVKEMNFPVVEASVYIFTS